MQAPSTPAPRTARRRSSVCTVGAAFVGTLLSLVACAHEDDVATPDAGIGEAEVAWTSPEAAPASRELDWLTHIKRPGRPTATAVVIHDSGTDGTYTPSVACAYAEGLSFSGFAVDVVSVGQSAALRLDYDLVTYVSDGRRRRHRVDVLAAIPRAQLPYGQAAVVIVAGREPLFGALEDATRALDASGAYLVDAATFPMPTPDWDGPEQTYTMAFVEHEAEAFGRCVGDLSLAPGGPLRGRMPEG